MCYCSNLICWNTVDGNYFPLKCRSYTCSEHGFINRSKLRRAIQKWVENWDTIRLWTFTLSSRSYDNSSDHAKALSKVWNYFNSHARRSGLLNAREQGFQYIRFSEPHKSGYFHFHIILDRYISWYKIYALWNSAIEAVTGLKGESGGCHVKGIRSAVGVSWYIVKYVTKSALVKETNMKLYTKSHGVAFFPQHEKQGVCAIYNMISGEWSWPVPDEPLLVTSNAQLDQFVAQITLWPLDIPPPDPPAW